MSSVIVIGGGAAGIAAAIASAACGDQVTLLERMDRIGRKILATGNGRCNLMNVGVQRYPGGSGLAEEVLNRCGIKEQNEFWAHLGLRMRVEEAGRVYPVSGMASTVLDTLRLALDGYHVDVHTEVHVTGVFKARHGWTVMAGEQKWKADRVIVAGGGCTQPKLGSDGSAWPLLTAMGHHLVQPKPALTQIITETKPIKGLSGIRAKTTVRITQGRNEKHRESGELLFADYGVTGVCVMQCARYAEVGDVIHIDLAKAMGFDGADGFRAELLRRRRAWGKKYLQTELMTGLCVSRLAQALFTAVGMNATQRMTCDRLTDEEIDCLTAKAVDFTLTVKGCKGFDSAQVTAGGIAVDEFDPDNLESRLAPGIHAVGELLDVDGDCGGFNLMFAFASGILAGLNGRPVPW